MKKFMLIDFKKQYVKPFKTTCGSREVSQESIPTVQERNDNGLKNDSSHKGNSGYSLKVELTGLADGLEEMQKRPEQVEEGK